MKPGFAGNLMNKDSHERERLKVFCDALVMDEMPDSAKVKVFTDWICNYLTYDKRLYINLRRGFPVKRPKNRQPRKNSAH